MASSAAGVHSLLLCCEQSARRSSLSPPLAFSTKEAAAFVNTHALQSKRGHANPSACSRRCPSTHRGTGAEVTPGGGSNPNIRRHGEKELPTSTSTHAEHASALPLLKRRPDKAALKDRGSRSPGAPTSICQSGRPARTTSEATGLQLSSALARTPRVAATPTRACLPPQPQPRPTTGKQPKSPSP